MTEIAFPSYTDDVDEDGTTGTVFDDTFWDGIATAINTVVHSTTNPTISAADAIDETVTARGSKASLDARLDVSLEEDGSLIVPADYFSADDLGACLGTVNLLGNDDFLIWPDGDAAAPAYWATAGSPTVARCGTGCSDTTRKVGPYCASLTYGVATSYLWTSIVLSGIWSDMDFLEGQDVSFGCWVKSSIANHARIIIYDGNSATNSSYHTGGGNWEWLTATHTISSSATYLRAYCHVDSSGTAYFSGPTFIFSDLAPARWQPSPRVIRERRFSFNGALTVGDLQGEHVFERPALLLDVQACPGTPHDGTAVAPAVVPITIDVEKYETGGSWVSVFSGAQDIVAVAAFYGSVQPDGDYDHRCFNGYSGNTVTNENAVIAFNIDVTGSAEGFNFILRFMQYTRPLEGLLAYNDYGVA